MATNIGEESGEHSVRCGAAHRPKGADPIARDSGAKQGRNMDEFSDQGRCRDLSATTGTVFDVKRLVDRKFADPAEQADMKLGALQGAFG